jgi:hypothetical protein
MWTVGAMRAIIRGWTDAEIARLNEIFPSGFCDFSKGDQGRPPGFH